MKRCFSCGLLLLIGFFAGRLPLELTGPAWADPLRLAAADGDVNGDALLDLGDPVYLLNHLFQSGPPPVPCGAAMPTVMVLVRHAEREQAGSDPCLLPEGRARADRLAQVFRNARVDALVASAKCRTRETLQPLAALKASQGTPIAIEEIEEPQVPDTAAAVADRIRSLPAGSLAVVAHHSFTMRQILEALGIADSSSVDVNVFDNFIVVLVPPAGQARMVSLTYF
jgi:phosphohistidine phosphatase SixA